jgi:glycosyltransferase involved in cell wall biosynthesis
VVPSRAFDQALGALGLTAPRTVVPTGLAPDELGEGDGARFRAAHGIAAGRPVAVHVGRVAHEKNIGFLLEVAARVQRTLPGFLLVVAGEGPARPALERRARALGLDGHVLFVGYLDRRAALADCYRAGDCFVFASRTETQGLVLLEAMSLGVPVVALAEQGTAELLAAGRGARVPRDDVAEFAAAVSDLLRDEAARSRLGREGRELARSWSAAALAGRLIGVYRELLEAPGRREAVAPGAGGAEGRAARPQRFDFW